MFSGNELFALLLRSLQVQTFSVVVIYSLQSLEKAVTLHSPFLELIPSPAHQWGYWHCSYIWEASDLQRFPSPHPNSKSK